MQTQTTLSAPSIASYVRAGLIAGVIAAVIANVYYLLFQLVTGTSFAELNLVSITLAGIIPTVIGALVYYGLSRFTKQATTIFIVGGLILATLSNIPTIIAPPHAGFAPASIPLHYIVALVCLFGVPWLVKGRS